MEDCKKGTRIIRMLTADEIECRISMVNEKGVALLLFKDARVDQKILDETFGPLGWKRSHQEIGGDLYCTVEVWDKEKGQWIGKQDVGTPGSAEKEKGRASDSFKRACFNWGIGRELYTAPFIWIPAWKTRIQEKDGKHYCRECFRVLEIRYDQERTICELKLTDSEGQLVYEFQMSPAVAEPVQSGLSREQEQAMERELKRTGVTLEEVLSRYHIQEAGQITDEIYQKAMRDLKRSRSRDAA